MWLLFNVSAVGVWWVTRWFGFPFHAWILLVIAAALAAIFFLPFAGDRGFRISRARWCQAGVYVLVAYIAACGVAHHFALERVRDYAERNHLDVIRLAAIPSPPSLLDWSGKIRTAGGIYQARFDLRDAPPCCVSISCEFAAGYFYRRGYDIFRMCRFICGSRDFR